MSTALEHVHVLGVDPGTKTGFCHLLVSRPADPKDLQHWVPTATPAFQEAGVWDNHHQMWHWLSDWEAWTTHNRADVPLVVSAEAFIAGSNQRHGRGQKSLQDPLGMLEHLRTRIERMRQHDGREILWYSRSASTVKRWATDERLRVAFPHSLPERMKTTHARDAARHGLYAAVKLGYSRDPFVTTPA